MELNTDPYPELTHIDGAQCDHLKKALGYRLAKRLILESCIPHTAEGQFFLNAPVELGAADSVFHDELSGEDLKYNNGTGRRAWVCRCVSVCVCVCRPESAVCHVCMS